MGDQVQGIKLAVLLQRIGNLFDAITVGIQNHDTEMPVVARLVQDIGKQGLIIRHAGVDNHQFVSRCDRHAGELAFGIEHTLLGSRRQAVERERRKVGRKQNAGFQFFDQRAAAEERIQHGLFPEHRLAIQVLVLMQQLRALDLLTRLFHALNKHSNHLAQPTGERSVSLTC